MKKSMALAVIILQVQKYPSKEVITGKAVPQDGHIVLL